MAYDGLPKALRDEVLARDNHRCRWCGATNQGVDIHHVRYRRGTAYDVLDNLITLCRAHHSFVHGARNGAGLTITKPVAQLVLFKCVDTPGLTGSSAWRNLRRRWAREGRCLDHGRKPDECLDCPAEPSGLRRI